MYVKVCLWIFLLVRKQCLPKKSGSFSPKIGGKKNGQNPFQAILRLKKKVVWTTKPLGRGTLVVRPLKKHSFCVCLPLSTKKIFMLKLQFYSYWKCNFPLCVCQSCRSEKNVNQNCFLQKTYIYIGIW